MVFPQILFSGAYAAARRTLEITVKTVLGWTGHKQSVYQDRNPTSEASRAASGASGVQPGHKTLRVPRTAYYGEIPHMKLYTRNPPDIP